MGSNQSKPVVRFAARDAVVEMLDARRLLSASLVGNVLRIGGTEGEDRISVAASGTFINVLAVDFNGAPTYFSIADVQRVQVRAYGGDDVVRIDSSLDMLSLRSAIDSGDGNDTVVTGAGSDTINGGAGNDYLRSEGGDDRVLGDAGNDIIDGGVGDDHLEAGAGNDRVYGRGGDDYCDSGEGNDRVDAGDGADQLADAAGRDILYAGEGNDKGTFTDRGAIHGGGGNDKFTATAGAYLYGDDGNDTLTGLRVLGGEGSDSINGTARNDVLRGQGGDDLIYGRGGRDLIMGDAGADALYGGAEIDTLRGGDGDDNLYGDDGGGAAALARHSTVNYGHDVALGEAGSDWFEPTHNWARIDGNKDDREQLKPQNELVQDPNRGSYGSSFYGAFSSVNRFGAGLFLDGNNNYGSVTIANGGTLTVALGLSTPAIQSLGPAGWLVSGAYDLDASKFVPIDLSPEQQQAVSRMILQLPADWKLNEVSSGPNGLVWYRVSRPLTSPAAEGAKVLVPIYHAGETISANSFTSVPNSAGTITLSGSGTLGTLTTLTTATQVSADTPGAIDGVENGAYRFLALKRGTIIISGTGALTSAQQWSVDRTSLALPGSGFVRIAGASVDHSLAHLYRAAPDVPSAGLRGILLSDGAIWLPQDGSSPFFTAD
jgi:Ca2+-binding RTX toxin-like protein